LLNGNTTTTLEPKLLQCCRVSYHITSYCTFLRCQFKSTGATAINQTGKFSAVLRMFLATVSGHECRLASCSRCVGRRRQMICHIVQFLSTEHRASRYQLIACQDNGCRPVDSTQPNYLSCYWKGLNKPTVTDLQDSIVDISITLEIIPLLNININIKLQTKHV